VKCLIDQKRETDRPLVCGPCRTHLADDLRALVDAYAMLVVGEVLDGANDPVSQTLPAGTVRGGSRGAPVTGSRDAPVPISLDVVDLTSDARSGRVTDTLVPLVEMRPVDVRVHRVEVVTVVRKERNAAGEEVERRELIPVTIDQTERRTERVPVHGGFGDPVLVPAADQIGELPVATVLDQWVRDWRDARGQGEHLPVPTVVTLAGWLYDRLDWACDEHPSIDEFADEIRSVLHACNRAIGNVPVRPDILVGVPCATPECDGLLVHDPGSKYWAECSDCHRLWLEHEYHEWVGLVAAQARRPAA
jgi:hypothetical protein